MYDKSKLWSEDEICDTFAEKGKVFSSSSDAIESFNHKLSDRLDDFIDKLFMEDAQSGVDIDLIIDCMFAGVRYKEAIGAPKYITTYSFYGTTRMNIRQMIFKKLRKLRLKFKSEIITKTKNYDYDRYTITLSKGKRYMEVKSMIDINDILSKIESNLTFHAP